MSSSSLRISSSALFIKVDMAELPSVESSPSLCNVKNARAIVLRILKFEEKTLGRF